MAYSNPNIKDHLGFHIKGSHFYKFLDQSMLYHQFGPVM
jgi:hypothetical protein